MATLQVLDIITPPSGWYASNMAFDQSILVCYRGRNELAIMDYDYAIYYIAGPVQCRPTQRHLIYNGRKWIISLHNCIFTMFGVEHGETIRSPYYPGIRHLSGSMSIVGVSNGIVHVATSRVWARLTIRQ